MGKGKTGHRWEAGLCGALLALFALAQTAAAAQGEPPSIAHDRVYLQKEGGVPCQMEAADGVIGGVLPPGSTLYFAVENAARQSDLAGLRPFVRWIEGEDLATAPTLEYKKLYDGAGLREQGFCFVVGVRLGALEGEGGRAIEGKVSIGTRAGAGESYTFRGQVSANQGFEERETRMFDWFSPVMSFSQNQGVIDIFFGDAARFTVDAAGQGCIDLTFNSEEDDAFLARPPDFEGRFSRWLAGPVFNKKGVLYLYSDFEGVLYEYEGEQLRQPQARYDPAEGAWVIQTRRLGRYCIARQPLGEPLEAGAPARKENPPVGVEAAWEGGG